MQQATNEVPDVSEILPPRPDEGELKAFSTRLPEKLLEEVDRLAKVSGYSRNEVIVHFVRWALAAFAAEKRAKR